MKTAIRFSKYGGVAVGSFAVDWMIFGAMQFFGINYILSQGVSRAGGGIFSFITNKFWSFDAANKGYITVQGRRFLLLYGISYCLSISLLFLFVDILGVNAIVSKLMADGSCFIFNFIIMNVYVFKDRMGVTHRVRLLVRSLRPNE
jgi:putative flippase GtrA